MNGIGTVCAAMSGGVDSSVTAYLLQSAGFNVFGATMRLYRPEQNVTGQAEPQPCSSDRDINDARAVCDRLGIPYRVYDFGQLFRDTVIRNFAEEYASGRTPNPCVLCNKVLKFGALTNAARADGADAVATGHYARVEHDAGGRYLLKCATDAGKDQSYVLSGTAVAHTLSAWRSDQAGGAGNCRKPGACHGAQE